jgi:glycerophosphoryl diester phosphodiesterase
MCEQRFGGSLLVMSVDTAHVTRPRTGYPFLDEGIDQPGSVLAFAHRGGAFHPEIEGLENTMAAFEHAVDLGYRYLETDVHVTRDGALLAFHDAVLDRVTERKGAIADLTHAEVAEALIGGREQIPTLSALLERFPDTRFNIDIKSDAAVAPLAALVESTAAHDRICVGAFEERRIRRFRSLAGARVATAAGPVDVAVFRFVPATALVDVLARDRAPVLQVPHRLRGLKIVTAGLVARAHKLGKQVHVWTVDDPEQMRTLLDIGVDGMMTDRTDLLREVLVERGQWMGAAR